MKVSLLLTIAAVYAGIFGLLLLLVPDVIFSSVTGALATSPDQAKVLATVVGNARGYGGVLIGVAVMNWFARNSEANRARDAILLGMFVAFVALTLTGILRVMSGSPAVGGLATLVLNALLAVAFGVVGKANMSTAKK